ncbi:class I SAM-dependent methyltransferase [Myxosarcina sp. GI1(2024)]
MTNQLLSSTFNQSQADAFAEQLLVTLNKGALTLMISLGHRTGLFDTLATLPPATSQEIAEKAGLHERYVREWLNAIVVGGIINYDSKDKTYHLPAEHAAFLTDATSPNNMASLAQFIPVLAQVEEDIVACFYDGGGVPYAQYSRFHEVMAEDSKKNVVMALEDQILPLIPSLIERLEQGIEVLDVGCGRGKALNHLASLFPRSRFTGYDFCADVIDKAVEEAESRQLSNVRFLVKDAVQIDEVERYDLITTFDAIHDQAHPDCVLKNIYRALRPNGIYLMQEIQAATEVSGNFAHPVAPFLYTISCMHCMSVSLAAGGMGLGAMWGQEKALELIKEAGFSQIELKQLPHDFVNDYYIIRK